jgi:MFS family permease
VWPPLLRRGGADDLLSGPCRTVTVLRFPSVIRGETAVSGLGWHLPGLSRIHRRVLPSEASTASAIAVAFATNLLPFTVLGPFFVGVLLDRWSRRRILVVSIASRAVLLLPIAQLVVRGDVGWLFYLLVLTAFSVNRFLLAALSASMPHVVGSELLVTANAISPSAAPSPTCAASLSEARPTRSGTATPSSFSSVHCPTSCLSSWLRGSRTSGPTLRASAARSARQSAALSAVLLTQQQPASARPVGSRGGRRFRCGIPRGCPGYPVAD